MRRTADPRTEAWHLLQELMMGQKGRMFAIASEFELAPAQVMALRRLEPGRPCAMSELAGALRCDNSNVTGIADRLEARGLVSRAEQQGDRRVKLLALTDTGRELRNALEAAMLDASPVMTRLDAGERKELRDLLLKAAGEG